MVLLGHMLRGETVRCEAWAGRRPHTSSITLPRFRTPKELLELLSLPQQGARAKLALRSCASTPISQRLSILWWLAEAAHTAANSLTISLHSR